jgi:hypothetical protein
VVQQALNAMSEEAVEKAVGVVLIGNPYPVPGRAANINGHGRVNKHNVFGLFAVQAMQSNGTVLT